MRAIDQYAIESLGTPGCVLMENAGRAVAGAIFRRGLPEPFAVLCGPGNNGGDGLVIAHSLRLTGRTVTVIRASDSPYSPDAAEMDRRAAECGVPTLSYSRDREAALEAIGGAGTLVDALFGTGLSREIGGAALELIDAVNGASGFVLSVDLPSGADGDDGRLWGCCVKADFTVTLALPKPGLYQHPAAAYAGEIELVDIGLPPEAVESQELLTEVVDHAFALSCIPKRRPDSHKGDFGRLLVTGGSRGMAGSVTMAAMAALRCGAGLVTAACPSCIEPAVSGRLLEAMTLPLWDTPEGRISEAAATAVLHELSRCTAGVLGCGLGTDEPQVRAVEQIVSGAGCPLVLDADALNIIARDKGILKNVRRSHVLTPHPGEMARLMGCSVPEVQSRRIACAGELARETGMTVALKGAGTVTASPEGHIYVNATGNPGLSRGGSGDLLAGMIGAFLAQGMEPARAAACGAYFHGLAADLCVRETSEAGFLPTDILSRLPGLFK